MSRIRSAVVSCEHGGNFIPARYRALFAGQDSLLKSHRGYDPGALVLARELSKRLDCPLFYSHVSRLLVELNRSPHHPSLFSIVSRELDDTERTRVLQHYYAPHRKAVAAALRRALRKAGDVLHLSVHTFTPVLDGAARKADVGLLYDPGRLGERRFCHEWRASIRARNEILRVRRNYPYLGKADGFTTWLRRELDTPRYVGVELEVNQGFPLGDSRTWRWLRRLLAGSLCDVVSS